MSEVLGIFNPDDLPVEDQLDDAAKLLLWQRDFDPNEAAGRIFRVLYRETAGKGGVLEFKPPSKLMRLAEINSESTQRVAIKALEKAGLLDASGSKRGVLEVRFLCTALPPVPQQVLPIPGLNSDPRDIGVSDGEDESATPLRNDVAQAQCDCATPQTVEHSVLKETYVSILDQPEQTGAWTEGSSGGRLCVPSGDRVLRAVRRAEEISKLVGVVGQPGKYNDRPIMWALLEALYLFSESDLSGELENVKNKIREKGIKKTPGATLNYRLKLILLKKPREAYARVGLLDARGEPRYRLTYREMKDILKHYGEPWQGKWDQKPDPNRARSLPR